MTETRTSSTPALNTDQAIDTRRIVVGVDGSTSSLLALRWAARQAELTGARIDAIYTWAYPVTAGWATYPSVDWNPSDDGEKLLTAAVDEVFGSQRPAGLRLLVREGGAAQILLSESKNSELLVVGSRGHGGFTGLLLGSVSAHCAEHARCPVLVVHQTADQP
jgi:nucleotide-binding universal stress UspA family protein